MILSILMILTGSFRADIIEISVLDPFIRSRMAMARVPALAACIVKDGEIVWAEGYGWADREEEIPATPDMIFIQASVSKTVTATALMMACEDSLFSLDDDISEYLPFRVFHPLYPVEAITFRQLLAHTSGISDNDRVLSRFSTEGDSPIPLGYALEAYLSPDGSIYNPDRNFNSFKPGTGFEYSNIGYALCGYLVETVTGIPFPDYCEENLFDPLQMHQTSWFLRDLDVSRVAVPYWYNYLTKRYIALAHYGYPDYPDRQLRTSVGQLAHFLIAHMNFGVFSEEHVFAHSTAQQMREIQYPELDSSFGLGLYHWEVDGKLRLGHFGGDRGVSTAMWFRPDNGTGVIVMANGDTSYPWETNAFISIVDRLFEAAQ
jgi:CubicO group peptidase (beta-lactamase class C family)